MELEQIKVKADELGISYRSDIKAETLQAKIDSHKPAELPQPLVKPVVKDEPVKFKNTTTNNCFTESGKCKPQATVMLTVSQGTAHKALEQC